MAHFYGIFRALSFELNLFLDRSFSLRNDGRTFLSGCARNRVVRVSLHFNRSIRENDLKSIKNMTILVNDSKHRNG